MKQRQINTREFEQFYEKTAGAIRAYILHHCGNVSAVDDLFQITYTKFLNSRMAATPLADGASAYLYRIYPIQLLIMDAGSFATGTMGYRSLTA